MLIDAKFRGTIDSEDVLNQMVVISRIVIAAVGRDGFAFGGGYVFARPDFLVHSSDRDDAKRSSKSIRDAPSCNSNTAVFVLFLVVVTDRESIERLVVLDEKLVQLDVSPFMGDLEGHGLVILRED
jgi:hypothetical protein